MLHRERGLRKYPVSSSQSLIYQDPFVNWKEGSPNAKWNPRCLLKETTLRILVATLNCTKANHSVFVCFFLTITWYSVVIQRTMLKQTAIGESWCTGCEFVKWPEEETVNGAGNPTRRQEKLFRKPDFSSPFVRILEQKWNYSLISVLVFSSTLVNLKLVKPKRATCRHNNYHARTDRPVKQGVWYPLHAAKAAGSWRCKIPHNTPNCATQDYRGPFSQSPAGDQQNAPWSSGVEHPCKFIHDNKLPVLFLPIVTWNPFLKPPPNLWIQLKPNENLGGITHKMFGSFFPLFL